MLFNMGVPMIIPAMFFMALALVPIVLIESFYIAKRLGVRFKQTVGLVTLGNVVTTLVGIPATWLVLFLIQLITGAILFGYDANGFAGQLFRVTLQSPWLFPMQDDEPWLFHFSALFLLIPFYFATWLIEYFLMRDKLAIAVVTADESIETSTAEGQVWIAVRNANLLSYSLIALLIIVSLILVALPRT